MGNGAVGIGPLVRCQPRLGAQLNRGTRTRLKFLSLCPCPGLVVGSRPGHSRTNRQRLGLSPVRDLAPSVSIVSDRRAAMKSVAGVDRFPVKFGSPHNSDPCPRPGRALLLVAAYQPARRWLRVPFQGRSQLAQSLNLQPGEGAPARRGDVHAAQEGDPLRRSSRGRERLGRDATSLRLSCGSASDRSQRVRWQPGRVEWRSF